MRYSKEALLEFAELYKTMQIDEFCRVARCSPKRAIAIFGRKRPIPEVSLPVLRLDIPPDTDVRLACMIKIDTTELEDPYYSSLVNRCKEYV